jgi:hypothetical protein
MPDIVATSKNYSVWPAQQGSIRTAFSLRSAGKNAIAGRPGCKNSGGAPQKITPDELR